MELPEEIYWPVKYYKVELELHPKHQQPDGIWFFTQNDGKIILTKVRNIQCHFTSYNAARKFIKENTFTHAKLTHPTDKKFKL